MSVRHRAVQHRSHVRQVVAGALAIVLVVALTGMAVSSTSAASSIGEDSHSFLRALQPPAVMRHQALKDGHEVCVDLYQGARRAQVQDVLTARGDWDAPTAARLIQAASTYLCPELALADGPPGEGMPDWTPPSGDRGLRPVVMG